MQSSSIGAVSGKVLAGIAVTGVVALVLGSQAARDDAASDALSVSRAGSTMIALPPPVPRFIFQPVSLQLRAPVRITQNAAPSQDLNTLVRAALAGFGISAEAGDALSGMLVRTLAQGQTDAFIDAVLNSALERGEIDPPGALLTAQGRLDTPALLNALLSAAEG